MYRVISGIYGKLTLLITVRLTGLKLKLLWPYTSQFFGRILVMSISYLVRSSCSVSLLGQLARRCQNLSRRCSSWSQIMTQGV